MVMDGEGISMSGRMIGGDLDDLDDQSDRPAF